MSDTTTLNRADRRSQLDWILISDMRVSPAAQRKFRPAHAAKIAANMDLDDLGIPEVNRRDGHYYIIDGQHRVAALREIGWADQRIQCLVYDGLTEQEEAEKLLRLNDALPVAALDRFRIGVRAEREVEQEIDEVVRTVGLKIGSDKKNGAINAVGALQKVYQLGGTVGLARSLNIIYSAYGDAGLQSAVIHGIGLFCARYGEAFTDERAITLLSKVHGGVGGLLQKAATVQNQFGGPKYRGVAIAALNVLNGGKGGNKLPGWFRDDEAAA